MDTAAISVPAFEDVAQPEVCAPRPRHLSRHERKKVCTVRCIGHDSLLEANRGHLFIGNILDSQTVNRYTSVSQILLSHRPPQAPFANFEVSPPVAFQMTRE